MGSKKRKQDRTVDFATFLAYQITRIRTFLEFPKKQRARKKLTRTQATALQDRLYQLMPDATVALQQKVDVLADDEGITLHVRVTLAQLQRMVDACLLVPPMPAGDLMEELLRTFAGEVQEPPREKKPPKKKRA